MKKTFLILSLLLFICSCERESDYVNSITGGDSASCRYVESSSLSEDVSLNVPYCSENTYGPYSILAMVLSFYGNTEANYLSFDTSNFDEYKIKEKAIELGFFASILDCGFLNLLDAIDRTDVPVIVKVEENGEKRFLLVTGYNQKQEILRIHDQSDVLRKEISFDSFKNSWETCNKTMIIIRSGS